MATKQNSENGKFFKRRLPRHCRVYRLPHTMCPDEQETPKKKFRRRSSEAQRLRKTERWKRLSAVAMGTHPVCMLCLTAPGKFVHHIVPAEVDISLFFDLHNLAPLCGSCHRQVHEAYDRGIRPEAIFPEDKRLDAFS